MNYVRLFGYYLIFIIMMSDYSFSDLIHPNRRIIWEDNVGVEGGIPDRNIISATLNAEDYGNGKDDASAFLQQALDKCPENQVVYLNKGVYRLSKTVVIGNRITLRGAGTGKTILLADDISDAVVIGNINSSPSQSVDIVDGLTKGASKLILSTAASITMGKYIGIDELNEASFPVTNIGVGTCTWCSRENGSRARSQITKVINVSGDTITIDPTLYFDLSLKNSPQIQVMGAKTQSGMISEFSGIEDLTIKNNWVPDKITGTNGKEYSAMKGHISEASNRPVTGTGWDSIWVERDDGSVEISEWVSGKKYSGNYANQRRLLRVVQTANCWAKNIEVINCGKRCIELSRNNFRFEIRGCYISKCINRWDSDNCYGTLIGQFSSGILIEDNIYANVANGPMFGWGASGNVVGYNYIFDACRTNVRNTWFTGCGASHHGAHTTFNLWEGNEIESAIFDQYWGSHSHNTLFRNRIIGTYMVDDIADKGKINNLQTIATDRHVRFQNYLGNVLGTEGVHTVYELNSIDCPNGYGDKVIYRTGYASSGNCNASDADTGVYSTMLRHMNYDFVTKTIKYCGDSEEPPCQGGDGMRRLPTSLYLSSKPEWWKKEPWPPIGPDLNPLSANIPAKNRFFKVGETSLLQNKMKPSAIGSDQKIALLNSNVLLIYLPIQSHITVQIFNLGGKLLNTVINKQLGAGNHSVKVFHNDSGIFLIKVKTKSTTKVFKLLLFPRLNPSG